MTRTRRLPPDAAVVAPPGGVASRALHCCLVIALLVWVQVLAPFVHAHAGSAQINGWHLHTALSHGTSSLTGATLGPTATPAPLLGTPAHEGWRHSDDGPDAPEVGLAAGLPQARDSLASVPVATADGGVPILQLSAGARHAGACLQTAPPGLDERPACAGALRASLRAGLPPPANAPPLLLI